MNKYLPEEYWSVINRDTGKKVAECGLEKDAQMLVSLRPNELTYVKNTNHLMGQVIDIEIPKQLPTNEMVVVEKETPKPKQQKTLRQGQNKLPESDLEPLIWI